MAIPDAHDARDVPGAGGWHDVAAADDVEDDDVVQVTADGKVLALFNIDGMIYVTDDCCTHQQASLSEGYLQDDTIECPRHQGLFHIPSGRAMGAPVTEDLQTYPVRVDAGRVWVRM